ncbi:TSC22 domain family 2-like isoform X1 [Labeo rohita]|uniref:TSC22 domain family 2-like isoform X1 n=3 Tax=Labeo rohita TaxID=84645 RepID=A0A498M7J0_LABRO|nr:TSC22 domain family 2-like isoform X1 [Labeo rohita]RXN13595.1 TSC22 domain family 2-like isoform X1 [Labeo rohita]
MYAVREEVEVLKEQIKELYERNSVLERENAVLKSLANTEQLTQLTAQISTLGSTSPQQTAVNAILQEGSKLVALPPQPNVSTA